MLAHRTSSVHPFGVRSPSCEKFTVLSKSIAGQPPNNSLKPTPLRSGHAVAEKACHGVPSTTLRVLAQALGLASETSVARATKRSLIAIFRAAALALHSPQLTSGSSRTRPARCSSGGACVVSCFVAWLLAFARRRTRQQALPRVPACECEIFTGTRLGLQ